MASAGFICVKYMLFFYNLIFFLTGVALVVIGSMLLTVYQTYPNFLTDKFTFMPIIIIVIGGIILIIAFCGCCGTYQEDHCMLTTFASLLIILFILEILAAIACAIFQTKVKEILANQMGKTIEHYDSDRSLMKTWDAMQSDLGCCGINGTSDWEKKIPLSCCNITVQPGEVVTATECHAKEAYKVGCVDQMYAKMKKNRVLISLIAVVLGLIQMAAIGFACCLSCTIHRRCDIV